MEGIRHRRTSMTAYGSTMPCPVCQKVFPISRLSAHANKCVTILLEKNSDENELPSSKGKRDLDAVRKSSKHKQRKVSHRAGSRCADDGEFEWHEVVVDGITFECKALTPRMLARIQRRDAYVIANEEDTDSSPTRTNPKKRRRAPEATNTRETSHNAVSEQDKESLTESSHESDYSNPSEGLAHEADLNDALTKADDTAPLAMSEEQADGEIETDNPANGLRRIAHQTMERPTIRAQATSLLELLDSQAISQHVFDQKMKRIRKHQTNETKETVRAVKKRSPERTKRTDSDSTRVDRTGQASPSEKLLLNEHAAQTCARTQGLRALPCNVAPPLRASDHGATPQDMHDARLLLDRVKAKLRDQPEKLKEFYSIVLNHSQKLASQDSDKSELLAILVAFCKVFQGDEQIMDLLVEFMPKEAASHKSAQVAPLVSNSRKAHSHPARPATAHSQLRPEKPEKQAAPKASSYDTTRSYTDSTRTQQQPRQMQPIHPPEGSVYYPTHGHVQLSEPLPDYYTSASSHPNLLNLAWAYPQAIPQHQYTPAGQSASFPSGAAHAYVQPYGSLYQRPTAHYPTMYSTTRYSIPPTIQYPSTQVSSHQYAYPAAPSAALYQGYYASLANANPYKATQLTGDAWDAMALQARNLGAHGYIGRGS